MLNTKLKEALNNCLVNFDRRVLVTDLLEDYDSTYKEVHETLEAHIREQEAKQGAKFEKRFLVYGEAKEGNNEVYTVVQGENKLKEWLAKLKNAESSLYSVETAGGAKAPAEIFKPLRKCAIEVKSLKVRENTNKKIPNGNANGTAGGTAAASATKHESKTDKQPEAKKPKNDLAAAFAKKPEAPKSTRAALADTSKTPEAKKKVLPTETSKKVSPPETKEKKSTPEEKKPTATKPAAVKTKGIQNFFKKQTEKPITSVAPATKKESTAIKKESPTTKKESPTTKKKTTAVKKESPANTSMQLFEAEDEKDISAVVAVEMSDSSDEEEKLDALKRNILSDHEGDDDDAPSTSNPKRRRIEDSDDDDEPLQKHEKTEEQEIEEVIEIDSEPTVKSETFMDEDGFVITLKSKKTSAPTKSAAATKKSKPSLAAKSKSPMKRETKPKATAPTPKTKQGNIMNFFTKK